ncbi:molecular chaperone Hsp90 [Nocardia thailandica]|uniref:molecular chaperone Hsp90 n=1 Tax=Nocardia thailandica TaxID=257275 RepID=UPI0003105CC6|nr:molecular chaperone Hsp90 [Nocardia thailandica]
MLAAWRDSPTRLREDSATEADLVAAGYRDRLLTELAQNAADAAQTANVPGELTVRLDADRRLHVTNTGAPLSLSGVHALTALRASAKPPAGSPDPTGNRSPRDDAHDRPLASADQPPAGLNPVAESPGADPVDVASHANPAPVTGSVTGAGRFGAAPPTHQVGRFGVGFTAVRTVADEIEVRSTTGSIRFSRAATANALHEAGIEPGDLDPPVLRLAWPVPTTPVAGADTEVVLHLRSDVDAGRLLAGMRAEAPDLLLELPALRRIRIEDDEFRSGESASAHDGIGELRIVLPGGETRTWWQFRTGRARWLLPVRDGRPRAAAPDVLRAPTRSDEELSLPALLVADLPMQPDRRRLLPGARPADIARGYADFARALPPADRLVLVPAPGFARSETDGLLREAVTAELRSGSWLPVVGEKEPAAPARASAFPDLTAELGEILADLTGPLVIPELSGRAQLDRLSVLDVHRLGPARLADITGGIERPPHWWRAFYAALEPFVHDTHTAEELGALAVPLADGRLVTGPRTVVLDDQLGAAVPVRWARLVHPDAAHPLLGRLGARSASAVDLLGDPALRDLLDHDPADPDTVAAVLHLAARVRRAEVPDWLGLLELPDDTGEPRPADELLLPDAPLREVLAEDAPFGTVAAELVAEHGPETLRAIGVGWDFAVLTDPEPVGPDHDLDDEDAWWGSLAEDPREFAAVRDLDLVDEDRWPLALRHLLDGERTRPLLADPDGYTVWWLHHHAHIDGIALGHLRHPDDTEFAGLLTPLRLPGASPADLDLLRPVLVDPATMTPALAEELLDALADPAKDPAPEAVSRAHSRIAAAFADGALEARDLALPEQVRALSGAVADADRALVLDEPWFGLALDPAVLVPVDPAHAGGLATLLDLPTVSDEVGAEVLGEGRPADVSRDPLAVVLRGQWAAVRPVEALVVHTDLRVRLTGAVEETVRVPWWWVDGTLHLQAPRG